MQPEFEPGLCRPEDAPLTTSAATRQQPWPQVRPEVQVRRREYFTVQHRLDQTDGWQREIPPLVTADEAIAVLRAHAHSYRPGDIRAVRKIVRTTVEVSTSEIPA